MKNPVLRDTSTHLLSLLRHTTSHLQHTATHCNTLQHTATHYNKFLVTFFSRDWAPNTLQHTAIHHNTLQHAPRLSYVSVWLSVRAHAHAHVPTRDYAHVFKCRRQYILRYVMWFAVMCQSIKLVLSCNIHKSRNSGIFLWMFSQINFSLKCPLFLSLPRPFLIFLFSRSLSFSLALALFLSFAVCPQVHWAHVGQHPRPSLSLTVCMANAQHSLRKNERRKFECRARLYTYPHLISRTFVYSREKFLRLEHLAVRMLSVVWWIIHFRCVVEDSEDGACNF